MGWGKVEIPPDRSEAPPLTTAGQNDPDPLPYAGILSQRGVLIDRWWGGARVVVPPPRGWRMFLRWEWLAIGVLTTWFVIGLINGRVYYVIGPIALVFLACMLYTFWRPQAFQVDEKEVCVGFVHGRKYWWTYRWPRSAVGEIRMNSVNGKLLLRITGKSLEEISLGGGREVTREVASVLQAALSQNAPNPGSSA